jgi:hypothetical protein
MNENDNNGGASIAQSSEQGPFTSEYVWVRFSIHFHVKVVGFIWVLSSRRKS